MNRHTTPYIICESQAHKLESTKGLFLAEDQLQDFIFKNHHAIPIDEIEPAFGPLIPVCRELPTNVGPVDLLFINRTGLLTLVECKLWKNPQARRVVIGQILDYATEMNRWSYEQLEQAIGNAPIKTDSSLVKLAIPEAEDMDERDFVDSVSRNLRRGRFLLLIVGDGIRENMEHIANFLQEYAHLNFALALVEFGIFKLPENLGRGYLVEPRLLTKTVEIERAAFRIEDGQIVSSAPAANKVITSPKRTTISEQVFFERLKADSRTKVNLKALFEKVQELDLSTRPGQNSIILKSSIYGVNFGIFHVSGEFYNGYIASASVDIGRPEIGVAYLEKLAALFNHGFVKRTGSRTGWTVKIKSEDGERLVSIVEILAVQDKWIKVIQQTLNAWSEAVGE
jgi:hypothetical protein